MNRIATLVLTADGLFLKMDIFINAVFQALKHFDVLSVKKVTTKETAKIWDMGNTIVKSMKCRIVWKMTFAVTENGRMIKMIEMLAILICAVCIVYPIYKISYLIGFRNGYKQCTEDTFDFMVDEGT